MMTDLEKLVTEIQQAGQDWVEAKLKSDQLESDEKNYLSALMNDLEKTLLQKTDVKLSEAKLERMARGSEGFRSYVVGRVTAASETGRKKVRYEAALNFWEAKRSQMAFERAQLEKGIFERGR